VFLKSGDIVFGGRVALGGVAGASFGFAANAEYGIQENIGVGAFFGYSGYKETFFAAEASYTNILVLGSVNYHQDFLKIQNLDTWAAVSLGYNVASVSLKPSSHSSFSGRLCLGRYGKCTLLLHF